MRDGGTRSISNSSVQILSDMMRLGDGRRRGHPLPRQQEQKNSRADPLCLIQKFALIPA